MSQNTIIRETIDAAISEQIGSVPTGYGNVVEAVKVAVEGLASSAAESLTESGRALGASDEQVQAALVSAGLVEIEPEPEVAEPAAGDTEARLSKIESAIERLTSLAESAQRRFGL